MKHLLPIALLLAATAAEAQTWSELPVVTADYTAYTTTRLKIDPVTHTPYVAFKARKEVATGEDYTHALIYRYVGGQWQKVAASTDQVYSNYLDFGFSKTGRSYIAYADADSTVKGTTLEQVIPAAQATRLLAANTEKAQATYLGLGVVSDDLLVSACTGNTNETYKNLTAVTLCDIKGGNVTAELGPSGKTQTYKSTLTASATGQVYMATMERATPYAIHVYQYNTADNAWTELGQYPQEGANAIYVGTFKLSTDKKGNVYTLTCDDASGAAQVRIRQWDAETQQWSTVGDAPAPIYATSRYQLAAHAKDPYGKHVIVYQDLADQNLVKAIEYNGKEWSKPVTLSTAPANNSGSIALEIGNDGIGYATYLDADNGVRVCQYTTSFLDLDWSNLGLVCDTLSYETFQMPASTGSGKVFGYTSPRTGVHYTFGGYAYNNVLRDEWDGQTYRDTTQLGLNIRKRLSNGVQTGIWTTGAERPMKAKRVRVRFIYYDSPSMLGRTLTTVTSDTPFVEDATLEANIGMGKPFAEVDYEANGVCYFLPDSRHLGFHTESTGFGIRDIIVGWMPCEEEGIEAVSADRTYDQQRLYNLQGQLVRSNTDGELPAGLYVKQGKIVTVR